MKKVTWADYRTDKVEIREIKEIYNFSRAFGRVALKIVCPFCNSKIIVYLWSYSAVGKRCDCGALLGNKEAFRLK